jgi:ribosomal protein S27AE
MPATLKEAKLNSTKQCPKCSFAGDETDKSKFSEELINRFPKGYAPEKHPKIEVKTISGKQVQFFVYDDKKQLVIEEIKRCPVCGYVEGEDKK